MPQGLKFKPLYIGDGLCVKPSLIRGAGKGLFVTRDVKQGQIITEYDGVLYHRHKAKKQLVSKNIDQFNLTSHDRGLDPGLIIRGLQVVPDKKSKRGGGSFLNHAFNAKDRNCTFKVTERLIKPKTTVQGTAECNFVTSNRVWIKATKDIKAFEELLCSYGTGYKFDKYLPSNEVTYEYDDEEVLINSYKPIHYPKLYVVDFQSDVNPNKIHFLKQRHLLKSLKFGLKDYCPPLCNDQYPQLSHKRQLLFNINNYEPLHNFKHISLKLCFAILLSRSQFHKQRRLLFEPREVLVNPDDLFDVKFIYTRPLFDFTFRDTTKNYKNQTYVYDVLKLVKDHEHFSEYVLLYEKQNKIREILHMTFEEFESNIAEFVENNVGKYKQNAIIID